MLDQKQKKNEVNQVFHYSCGNGMVHFFYTWRTSISMHLHSFKKVNVKKGWDVKNKSLGFEPKQMCLSFEKSGNCFPQWVSESVSALFILYFLKMLKMLQVNITTVFTQNCIFLPGMQAQLADEYWPLWYVSTSTSANTAGNWNLIFACRLPYVHVAALGVG